MAIYSKILELINGTPRTVDLSTNTLSVQGLQINAATGGGSITQAAHSTTTSYSIIWPQAQAALSGYVLTNDGSGNLSWSAAASPLTFSDSLVNTAGNVTLVNDGTPTASQYYGTNASSILGYYNLPTPGTGTVTSVSVVSANGFTGTVATATTTPAITLTGTLSGDVTGTLTATVLSATTNATLTTLSGLTTASALVTVGTITTGTWHGSTITVPNGGTGVTTFSPGQPVVGGVIGSGPLQSVSQSGITAGEVLTYVGLNAIPTWQPIAVTPSAIALTDGNILVGNVSNVAADVTMSGDATIVSSGALTLATVATPGTTGSSTAIPVITINTKGLTTSVTTAAVIAPAGTLSGTTLNPTVVTSSLTSLGIQAQALDMGTFQINNLATPSISTDAANKGYVDSAISGLTWKGPATAYANSNVPLTGSTPLIVDGYTVLNGDLLILGNQTTASQNGEYSTAITGGTYTLTANGLPNAAGDAWLILKGTVFLNSAFVATAAVPAATFVEFAGPTSLNFTPPLILTGNTVTITQASGSANGYLSSTDWNTFNNKQPAGSYIIALTGDATASGPGSVALTFATVNANVGSFTNASITVNAKGLITAASSGTAAVTSISIAIANGLAGSSSGGTTPILTLSTTINSPVLAGNGTAISAATTTGTGSTVVLSASPTFTGTVAAANVTATKVTLSGALITPVIEMTAIYGGATTLTANTTYAMRWGVVSNSETAGSLYVADWNTSSFDLFWVVGLFSSLTSVTTGTTITVATEGVLTLGSSDTPFGSTDQGKAVWLGAGGAYIPNSTFAPSSGDASEKLGVAIDATTIWVNCQLMGVN